MNTNVVLRAGGTQARPAAALSSRRRSFRVCGRRRGVRPGTAPAEIRVVRHKRDGSARLLCRSAAVVLLLVVASALGAAPARSLAEGAAAAPRPRSGAAVCGNGLVESAAGEECDDGDANGTAGSCCKADCVLRADGRPCDDGDACTVGDACAGGACSGAEVRGCGDDYFAVAVLAPKKKAGGAVIAGNVLPSDFALSVDDRLLDGVADDPENFLVYRQESLLDAAAVNGGRAPRFPGVRYARYRIGYAKEGAGAAGADGRFPRPVKLEKRVWKLKNRFGTINVRSKRHSALLVPTAAGEGGPPNPPGGGTHYTCYQVAATSDVTDQTPDEGGGTGGFRKDLQAFFAASLFDDCRFLADGSTPGFAGTAVADSCLFDLVKPVELCNPAGDAPAEAPRKTSARIDAFAPAIDDSLLCYKVKRAARLEDPGAAALAGGAIGDAIAPRQARHAKRSQRLGNPVYVAVGGGFPAPAELDTRGDHAVCVPTSQASKPPQPPFGEHVVAHYDFTAGLEDLTGQRGAALLAGGATLEAEGLRVAALEDAASVAIPGPEMYVAGVTEAIEVEARLRTDAVLGYGVTSAGLVSLSSAWNAYLSLTHDKWSVEPAQVIGGGAGTIVSKVELAPYWPLGEDHHLRMLLDDAGGAVWVDGMLVKKVSAANVLAAWNRSQPTTLSVGSFQGWVREIVVRRWDDVAPAYPDDRPPFEVTDLEWVDESRVRIRWNSVPGRIYTVETSADGLNWIARADAVVTATSLSSYLALDDVEAGHRFVRVVEGNVFAGQGPIMIAPAVESDLPGTTVNFRWFGNVPGVQQWQVRAGSAPGGAEYFESPALPAGSSRFPVANLPGRGEDVFVTLRFQFDDVWQQKVFSYRALESDDLPAEREGIFPVMRPSYEGVDQLLLLSDEWLIVAVNDQAEIGARIDELSGGLITEYDRRWMIGQPAGNAPDWTAWTQAPIVRDTYLAAVRSERDESRYGRPDFFAFTSADDPHYASPQIPLAAERYYVGLDKARVPGSGPIHYDHYCYLQLPRPMENGKHYTVTLGDGKAVSFVYDERTSVSRAIKLNQNGYLPAAGKKFAYIGAWIPNRGPLPLARATTFEVVDANTGETALAGDVVLRESNPRFRVKPNDTTTDPESRPPMHGEDVYEIDLSGLTATGHFFISVPGVGRSWTFRHGDDAYGEAFYQSARGLFHQRAAMAYRAPYTPWSRVKAHAGPVYESELIAFPFGDFQAPRFDRFDVVGATTDVGKTTEGVTGGWYDAADYDRNLWHYTNIFDLLYAFELAPRKFSDAMLNIPESGNGIPDILDEAEYGLDVWTRSMTADGGVSGWLETNTHPSLTDTTRKWSFSRRTRWSSLLYAAAAAQFAELVTPFDAERARRYRDLAVRAFRYGNDPAHSLGDATMHARTERGTGTAYEISWTELDRYIDPYLFHAKLRLYELTGEETYLADIEDHLAYGATPWQWPNTFKDCVPWFYFNIARRGEGIFPQALVDAWRAKYVGVADQLVAQLEGQSYRHTWPNYQDWSMAWGETTYTNRGRTLLMAFALTGDDKYRDAAICNLDYMLGANPMGMSWTTGIGFTYPAVLQHEVSETDGITDPIPGLSIYGIDGGPINYLVRDNAWSCPADPGRNSFVQFYANPATPLYRRWVAHPTGNTGQNEFTVWETMSSMLFSTAMLLPDGWTPPAALVERRPRHEDSLFGFYYLP